MFLLVNIILLCFIHSLSVKYTSKVDGKCYNKAASIKFEMFSACTYKNIAHFFCIYSNSINDYKTSVRNLKHAKSASQINIEMKSQCLPNNEFPLNFPPVEVIKKTLTDLAAGVSCSSDGVRRMHSRSQQVI